MLFAIAEDRMVWVLEKESDARVEFEVVDVESGVYAFYAEDGCWLRPRLVRSKKRTLFGMVEQTEFELERMVKIDPGADSFQVAINEAHGVEPNPYFKTVAEIRAYVEKQQRSPL
ncbi:hypothetical protein [Luteimonas panaciterrae]|uniref:hypothetical protein n=1 Tax=Luteimonas panaciterrae TaxID=363885 RepID=UPI001CFAC81F|nr:hypothetical protein [Luteimonas panaciterrae]